MNPFTTLVRTGGTRWRSSSLRNRAATLATRRLLQHACRITLFTRPGCGLCDNAKGVLSQVWDRRPFDYAEVNIMEEGQAKWRDVYEFDVPVIHVENSQGGPSETTLEARKLMHRFKPEEVEKVMDEAESN